jgi:PGF-CTERM protein
VKLSASEQRSLLMATEDTNGSKTFDQSVDEPYLRDGGHIEAPVEPAIFEGGTATTTIPGFGFLTVVIALLGGALLARRR